MYFGITPDRGGPEKDVVDAKMIPGRGAWLEFEVDKKDICYVRIDRKRKQPITILLKALGFGETDEELAEPDPRLAGQPVRVDSQHAGRTRRHAEEAFIEIYNKLRPGEPPRRLARASCSTTCSSTRSATTSRGRPLQAVEEAARRVAG